MSWNLGPVFIFLLFVTIVHARHRRTRLPPGPPRLPLVGNILDIPKHGFDWLTYSTWADKYGPVVSASLPGITIVVVHSWQDAVELLEKRSSRYSGRPYNRIFDLMGWSKAYGLVTNGSRHRGYRKAYHEYLSNPKALRPFHSAMESLAKKFCRSAFDDPDHLADYCYQYAGSSILRLIYGYSVKDGGDEVVEIANKALMAFNAYASPGKFMVNQLSFLQYVPEWFPGGGWRRAVREDGPLYDAMVNGPWQWVKQRMVRQKPSLGLSSFRVQETDAIDDSLAAKVIRKGFSLIEEDYAIHAAGNLFGAGVETTSGTLQFFYLAMLLFPEYQSRLHAEMNEVVGASDHLPQLADRPHLPLLDAMLKEVLRFFVTAPVGLPHYTTEEDIYNGYYIPKDTIVFANIWKICRDPETFSSPERFYPERFLGPNPEKDPHDIVFGFGRRICPGRYFADSAVWIAMATTIHCFSIQPIEKDGQPVPPSLNVTGGFISHSEPYPLRILPRQDKGVLAAVLSE